MHDDDNKTDAEFKFDMEMINHAVIKQDFTTLNRLIINTNNVGSDIVLLLAMCTLLHTQVKALREELGDLRREITDVKLA